jgi:glutathione S-transferase
MDQKISEPVGLYTFANSPFGAKVYWALVFKRAEFDMTYVNPLTTKEIAFSKQSIVPVLKVGQKWLQDSRESCLWLEELYPDRPFCGSTAIQQEAVIEADQWVTDNITALHFFSCIDKRESQTTKRNAMRMANVILPTTESLPGWFKKAVIPVWPLLLRTAGFVKRAANRLDTKKDIKVLHAEVLQAFEDRASKTGFIAGTEQLSFADIAAFAEVAFCSTYEFEGTLNTTSSTAVSTWYNQVKAALPANPRPELFPQWPPNGFKNSI